MNEEGIMSGFMQICNEKYRFVMKSTKKKNNWIEDSILGGFWTKGI